MQRKEARTSAINGGTSLHTKLNETCCYLIVKKELGYFVTMQRYFVTNAGKQIKWKDLKNSKK